MTDIRKRTLSALLGAVLLLGLGTTAAGAETAGDTLSVPEEYAVDCAPEYLSGVFYMSVPEGWGPPGWDAQWDAAEIIIGGHDGIELWFVRIVNPEPVGILEKNGAWYELYEVWTRATVQCYD